MGLQIRLSHPDIESSEVTETTETTLIKASNTQPTADAGDNQSVSVGETVQFDGSGSSDPDGDTLSYEWVFGDGTTASGETVENVYESTGVFDAELTVEDTEGGTDTDTVAITVEGTTSIGETGTVSVDEDVQSRTWKTISFGNSYTDPIILIKPIDYSGSDPSHIRVRNVTGSSAEVTVKEWEYLDGNHATVTVHYVVLESGTHELEDGTLVETGTVETDDSFASISFSQSFGSTPVVFTQSQTYNGSDPIVTRNKNVSLTEFETKLQEEESNESGTRAIESVGYIAIEPTVGTNNNRVFEVGTTANTVTENWHTINFSNSYGSDRNAILDIQTYDGTDLGGLRYRDFNSGSLETFVEEEQSADSETGHTSEEIGYWILDGDGDIIGT